MRHLSPDQLLDVAEGAADTTIAAHAVSCATCAAEVAQLKTMLATVNSADVPEPSPLFWDHFSARVRDAVAEEPEPGTRNPNLAPGTRNREPFSSFFLLPSIFAGVAVLLIATAVSWRVNAPVFPPASSSPDLAFELRVEPRDVVVPAAPVDDAPLDLLAVLVADLDWEDATEAGLAISSGTVDRVVGELSATEREELHRLLTVEMAGKVL